VAAALHEHAFGNRPAHGAAKIHARNRAAGTCAAATGLKRNGKGTIELPNTGGYFITTFGDMNRNRYGVLFTPDGKPISLR
jgi:hypothetical protein